MSFLKNSVDRALFEGVNLTHDEIVGLPRDLLWDATSGFSDAQIILIMDLRRKGKNRLAAIRSRDKKKKASILMLNEKRARAAKRIELVAERQRLENVKKEEEDKIKVVKVSLLKSQGRDPAIFDITFPAKTPTIVVKDWLVVDPTSGMSGAQIPDVGITNEALYALHLDSDIMDCVDPFNMDENP